jgi:hypothetical protein
MGEVGGFVVGFLIAVVGGPFLIFGLTKLFFGEKQ